MSFGVFYSNKLVLFVNKAGDCVSCVFCDKLPHGG